MNQDNSTILDVIKSLKTNVQTIGGGVQAVGEFAREINKESFENAVVQFKALIAIMEYLKSKDNLNIFDTHIESCHAILIKRMNDLQ